MALDNALGMTDEEFLSQDLSTLEDEFDNQELEASTSQEDEQPTQDTEVTEELTSEADVEDQVTEPQDNAQEQPEPEPIVAEDSQPFEDTQSEQEPEAKSTEPASLDTEDKVSDTDGDTRETPTVDFQGAYEKIFSPFKANGTEMRVDTVEDVMSLMKMGANYQKKMAALAPNLKIVKMLEKNNLLDASKLNNLIDLSKNNPAAISKLIKDSGIDPLDIDTDEDVQYTPNEYHVSDKEYKLDEALESIKDSSTFKQTIDVLSTQWDTESKNIISDNPQFIGIIDEHMQNGVYAEINKLITKERALGRLEGVSDITAYKQAAQYLANTGVLNDTSTPSAAVTQPTSDVSSKTKAQNDAKLSTKRKAAASTKTSSKPATSQPDFLKMTDDEFMKMAAV
jgi:hypothetical protein